MKSVEELKGMTQEDLVRLVQELQDTNVCIQKDQKMWADIAYERKQKIESLTKVVKELSNMLP